MYRVVGIVCCMALVHGQWSLRLTLHMNKSGLSVKEYFLLSRSAVMGALMVAALAGGLSACGGGGDDDTSVTTAAGAESDGRAGIRAVTATTAYYVDATAGSDTNAGSLAAPWKTLSRLKTAGLTTGQSVYLRCGAVWRESLALGATQLADGVSFGAYGTECATSKPRILGSDNLTGGWAKTGNVWSRKVTTGTPKIARLFINGVAQRVAQWPNHTASAGFASVDASNTASNLQFKLKAADALTLKGKDLVGATAFLRSMAWSVDAASVGSFDTTTNMVRLGKATAYATGATTEYVLTDKQWMVDAPGEFFHDTVNNTVYVYPADAVSQAKINSSQIEGSVRDVAVSLSGRKGLSVSGIAIEMARVDGLALSQAPESSVSGIDVRGHGRYGVQAVLSAAPAGNARGLAVRNSTIADNGLAGIFASDAMRVDVVGNTVLDTGTQAVAGNSVGAILVGPESIVENNIIKNSAYLGVRFSGTGGSLVTGNQISGHCARLTDCGAIYTWNGPKATRVTANQSASVSGNLVQDTSVRRSSAISGSMIVAGVYLDDYSLSVTVRDNTLTGGPYGIYVHNGSNHVIDSNRLWLNTQSSIWAFMDQVDADYMIGNTFSSNEIVRLSTAIGSYPSLPMVTSPLAFQFTNKYSGTTTLASQSNAFTLNRVLMLNAGGARFARVTTAKSDSYLDPAGWRGLNAGETIVPAKQRFVSYQPVLGTELWTNGGFTNGLNSWGAWLTPPTTGSVFAASSTAAGCTGACTLFTSTVISDYLYSPAASLTLGKMYRLSSDTVFLGKGNFLPPFVGRTTMPYATSVGAGGMVSSSSMAATKGEVSNFTGTFIASGTASAVAMFRVSPAKTPVAFDNMSLREVQSYKLPNVSEYLAVFSAGAEDVSVNCSTLGWPTDCSVTDAAGNAVTLPTVVTARSAKLLLRKNSVWAN
jgi:parallel beta-helix repeat protein